MVGFKGADDIGTSAAIVGAAEYHKIHISKLDSKGHLCDLRNNPHGYEGSRILKDPRVEI